MKEMMINVYRCQPDDGFVDGYFGYIASEDVINDIKGKFGGGRYKLQLVDYATSKVIRTKSFEASIELCGPPRGAARIKLNQLLFDCFRKRQSTIEVTEGSMKYVVDNMPYDDWAWILPQLPDEEARFWAKLLKDKYETF